MLVFLLTTIACDGNIGNADDTGGNAIDDTGGETDTEVELTRVTFQISGDYEATALGLDWVSEAFAFGGTLATSAAGGTTVSVDLAAPAEGDLLPLDGYPGISSRQAVPYLYLDSDSSLVHDSDEVVEAVGTAWLLYLAGDLPAALTAVGLVPGWNAVDPTALRTHSLDAIPLDVNLQPILEQRLGGSLSGDATTHPGLRLALVPMVAVAGGDVSSLSFNQTLGDPWSVVVGAAPGADHLAELRTTGLSASFEVPMAYTDTTLADGRPDPTEVLWPSCLDDQMAFLLWMAPPTDPLLGYVLLQMELSVGWSAMRTDDTEPFVLLTTEEADLLEIGGSCSLEVRF